MHTRFGSTGFRRFSRVAVLAAALGMVGCGSDDGGNGTCEPDPTYDPKIDPAEFVTKIDEPNPLWPLVSGTKTVFEGAGEHIEVTVTDQTKVIMGVTCVVVRDTVTEDGELVEDTYDWFAQDKDGNVWYFGEDSKEYDGGEVVSAAGSWEAGVDGAKPGIVMHKVQPPTEHSYRQEYYACEAEDMAEVVNVDVSVGVPAGSYDHCLKTREFTPLEPGVSEYKYYCDGVGLVLEEDAASGDRVELIQVDKP